MLDFDMLTVFIFLILYIPIFYYLKKRKKKDKPCLLLCTLFYIYIVLVIKYTQFPIFFGKLYSDAEHFKLAYNLIPIIKLTKNDVLTSILNIILFLPFGFLYFILSRFSYKKTLLAGFCTSLLIELSQVCISILTLVSFRIFDINDLIFNDLLVQFRYVFESGFELTYREISIYETARKIILKNSKIVDVAYPMFEKQFKEIIGDLESESIIFDITALPKNVSIDIISKLMSLGLNNIVLLNVKESEFALYHTLVRQSSLEVRSYFQKDYFSKKYDKRLFKCSKIVKLIALFFAELIEYWPIVKVIFMAFSTFSI